LLECVSYREREEYGKSLLSKSMSVGGEGRGEREEETESHVGGEKYLYSVETTCNYGFCQPALRCPAGSEENDDMPSHL